MAIDAADERTNQANLITARQSPGYLLVKELVADMADRRADRAMLDYTQQTVVSRQLVDGVWHNGRASDRESGDVMLAVMKMLANLDMTERRKKQSGKFGAKYNDHSYVLPIVSQGVKTGERVIVDLLGGQRASFKTYEDLGMRKKLAEQWADQMARDKGLVIISGLPEGGITTTTDVSIMETDRLLRDFVSIEEEKHREREMENIDVTTYSAEQGETPATILPALIRKYPNVYVCRDFVDAEAAKMLLNEIRRRPPGDHHDPGQGCHRNAAANVAEAGAAARVRQDVSAVLCVRLIRKLCEDVQGRLRADARSGEEAGHARRQGRSPVPHAQARGNREALPRRAAASATIGRTALFELLVVDDQIRQILLKEPKLELLEKAAKAAGMRTFQEEGVLLDRQGRDVARRTATRVETIGISHHDVFGPFSVVVVFRHAWR